MYISQISIQEMIQLWFIILYLDKNFMKIIFLTHDETTTNQS